MPVSSNNFQTKLQDATKIYINNLKRANIYSRVGKFLVHSVCNAHSYGNAG